MMRGKKKVNDFGSDPIPLLVLKISVPFMFAQFVNVLYSIVDRIYIGDRCGFTCGRRGMCADHHIAVVIRRADRNRRFGVVFNPARRRG